jgi:hypothetical protein
MNDPPTAVGGIADCSFDRAVIALKSMRMLSGQLLGHQTINIRQLAFGNRQ